MAGNIWKQFNESADWTYPSTSTLVEQTLDVISAGGNLPAGKLTLPPFKRMQDFTPADGKEVFILTDSVQLQGKEGKYDTVDYKYIQKNVASAKCALQRCHHDISERMATKRHPHSDHRSSAI